MATNKSKVLAYLPRQTYERLVLFQRDRGLSLSQAVALVIEDYFGLRTEPLGESVSDRLTRLENAVANLTELTSNSPGKSKADTDSPHESINQSPTDSNSNLLSGLLRSFGEKGHNRAPTVTLVQRRERTAKSQITKNA